MTDDHLDQIEAAFHLIDREVWIITARSPDGRSGGLVATWVMQSSIDAARPRLVAGIAANHFTAELIEASGGFAAHLISSAQMPLAWRFALGSGRDVEKLAGLETRPGVFGNPILTACLAWFDCRVIERHSTGDRHYYWAEVVDGGKISPGEPLRERQLFAAATPQQLAALRASRESDIAVQRPLAEKWQPSK